MSNFVKRPDLDLDLDALIDLAKVDPATFEVAARSLVEDCITRSGRHELELRRLQFRIDSVKYRERPPLNACLKISGMMWDKLLDLNEILQSYAAWRTK